MYFELSYLLSVSSVRIADNLLNILLYQTSDSFNRGAHAHCVMLLCIGLSHIQKEYGI